MKTSKRQRFASLLLALVMLMSLLPSAAFAEDAKSAVYVAAPSSDESGATDGTVYGDDTSGDGSETSPYATISKAYTEVADNGTIYLLSDLNGSNAINFNANKTVTITSADSNDIKTIYSKVSFGFEARWFFNVNKGEIIFKNITIDGTYQKNINGNCYAPGAVVASKATVTIDYGTTIQNFKKDAGSSGGTAVVKSADAGAVINIRDGVTIKNCVLETGSADDPAAVLSSGTGAILYMTGGTITGNTLSTSQSGTTAVVNIGKVSNPHFWMTGGKITGNTINNGAAAVYMRGEASACDIQFGDTAYVYGNYVNGTSGDQRNIYLKNNNSGTENNNVYVKLCSALTGEAKLGVYAEMIGMATKVAQGGGIDGKSYTATAADTTYFVSDKATDAEILYCGGSAETCGLLQHREGDTDHNGGVNAIYLSIAPEVTATKGNSDTITLDISRCTADATYVVLDKDMKPVTGKTLTGGAYVDSGNGTFKLTNADTTTTIGMTGLDKASGPYTVMLVSSGSLSVDSDGKANTDNLTDIATVNIVNFAGDGVTWSAGTTEFANGDFDIVTVPHNDQTGKANKTYTATPKTNYTFAAENAITATGNLGELTATKDTDAEKYNVSVTVPAYGTTGKGTSGYNTVTLTGKTGMSTGVTLLDKTGGEEMTDGKTYDGVAVAYTEANIDGASLTYTWQKVTKDATGATTYEDLTAAPSDAGEYNLKVTATSTSDSSKVLGTEDLPFTISKKALTVTATAQDKTYDGNTNAELKNAKLDGVLEGDKNAVSLDTSKITVAFADKNAGDSKAVTATVNDGALTGDKAGNYTIATATANNAKISQKALTATITATSKTYDGSEGATATVKTLTGVVDGDSVTATASNAVFVGGSGVDNNKTVSADITLSGDDASNYTLSKSTASATANITAKTLNVTVTAESKAYDGKTDAKATVTLAENSGLIGSDDVKLDSSNMKANFDTKEVGENKTVTVTGLKLDGDAAKNYKLPSPITGTANITQAESGVGTVSLTGWTYGDTANTPTASSTTNPGTATYQYRAKDADESAEWSDTVPTDAGTYTVKATFPANDNYGTTTATANFTIAKKTLTATITAKSKTYDGTNTAEVTKVELTGVLDGESVTATASNAEFAGVNARNDQTVTATITLDNSDAAKNYTVATTATTTASITAKTLTVTATASDKVYDGTTKATVTNVTLSGAVEGDTVSLNQSNMTAAFENATVGTGKTVTVSGLALDNNDNGNYKLPNTITTTANITKATGSGTVTLEGWTYGDTANTPTANSTTNGTTGVTYQYKLKDAEDSTYSATVPTDAGEYTVKATFPATNNYNEVVATGEFTISQKALTVNVTAQNKTYDGTTNATLGTATLKGVETADTENVTLVTTGVSAAFNNKNAGTDKPVTLTGSYTLSGEKAGNYTVTQPTGLTATITPAPLTITGATVTAKTYDGNDSATVTDVTFSGLQNGETLTFNTDYTVYEAEYDGVNATGTGAATKVDFNVVLTNTNAAKNYVLNTTNGSQSATIGKASHADETLNTQGKRGEENTLGNLSGYVVDGGTVGTITTNGADIFEETPSYNSATGTLTYKLKSSATNNQTATVTLPVTSANYNNYSIDVTVGVTPKETVEIGIDGKNFEYDGTAQAPTGITVAGNKVLVSALEVTYEGTDGTTYPESTTAPTNAGKYIMTVKVPDSNTRYTGSQTCAFEITKKPLTATITAENKTYDGTTKATVTPTLDGVVASDSGKVTAVVTNPAFENKNAGENKKVTAAITLGGTAAGNYTVNATAETTANISVKEVSITGVTVAASKTYDKTTAATLTNNGTISGKVDTDDLSITVGTASYDSANVGTNKTVSFTGFALTGTDASNYELTGQPASVKANITAKEVTISGVTIATTKVYDGNPTAAITNSGTLTGVETGDTVTIQTGTANYNNKNVGDNKTVTFSGFTLVGDNAGNYTLKAQPTETSAAITQREVTISGLSATKTYDGDNTAEKTEISGEPVVGNKAIDSDRVTLNTESMTGEFDNANAGTNKTVTIKNISLTGDDASNYKLPTPVTCTGTITTANGSGTVTLDGWTYGDTAKTPQPTSTTNGTGSVTYRYKLKTATGENAWSTTVPTNAGEYIVEATFAATNNYNEVVATAEFTIAKKALTITATAKNKTYDGNVTAIVDAELVGVVDGDKVKLDTTGVTASFDDEKAGEKKPVTLTGSYTLTGADANNYALTQPTGLTADITPAPLTLTITAEDKKLDGTNTATLDIQKAELKGMIKGHDKVTVGSATAMFVGDGRTAQNNVTVNVTNIKLTGEDAGNYSVTKVNNVTASLKPLTIRFMNGTEEYATTTVSKYNTPAEAVTAPTMKGLTFAGWCTDEECTKAWNADAGVTKDVTVYAKWTEDTLYTVSGEVTEMSEGSSGKSGATVELWSGSARISATVTDSNGAYSFGNVPNGVYNIVAKTDDRAVTKTVTVKDDNVTQNIALPASSVAAEVEVTSTAGENSLVAGATVTGMDTLIEKVTGSSVQGNPSAPDANERLVVKLNAKDGAPDTQKNAIKDQDSSKSNWDFVQMDVDWAKYSTVDGTKKESGEITDTVQVLAIRIPYDKSGKCDIVAYRYHADGSTADVAKLRVLNSEPSGGSYEDGTYFIGDGYIVVYTQKFSAIGFGYTADDVAPTIAGAENGKTYCAAKTLTITDTNLDSVTLNVAPVELTDGKLTLNPAEGTQTVVATDRAGNSTSITVTVNNGHTWGAWTSNGDGTHKRTCQFDAETETGSCSGGTATCSAAAVCTVCGGGHGEKDPSNHANLKHVEAKAATTAAEGNIEYWYCDGCEKYYKDASATQEIRQADTVTARLRRTRTYTRNYAHTTETTPQTIKTTPETGDESSMTLWLVLTLLSGAGVGATTVLGKRKRYGK